MTEPDLDEMLRRSAPAPSPAATQTALRLAMQVHGAQRPATRHGHQTSYRGRMAAAAVAGTLALTGAGTIAAYHLSVPPFQTLESGVERARTGIPVTYTNSLGREVECLAFIEYRNLDVEQRAAIETVSKDDRWEGYGERVLTGLGMPEAAPEVQNEAVSEVLGDDLWAAAHQAVPEMVYMDDASGPVFNGWSFSCANPGGVNGQP